LGFAGKS
jgi:hypothetical protein